jgi:hypothetical protein
LQKAIPDGSIPAGLGNCRMNAKVRYLLGVVLAGCLCGTPVAAADKPDAPAKSIAQRVAEREQALALLDDPDPITRASALEEILQSPDTMLVGLALKKVISGTDNDLRNAAVKYALSQQNREYVFTVTACGDANQGRSCEDASRQEHNLIPVFFRDMNQATGEFKAYSAYSVNYGNPGVMLSAGRIINGTVTFEINTTRMGNQTCLAHLQLSKAGRLEGTMGCSYGVSLGGGMDLF